MTPQTARRVHFGTPKYRNRPTVTEDGIKHASRREAKAWADLSLLARAGRIRNLERQIVFRIKDAKGRLICRYIADFVFEEYERGEWTKVVADAKGFPTPVYKLKKKMLSLLMGIEIREL